MMTLRSIILVLFGMLAVMLNACRPAAAMTPPVWRWQQAETGLARQAIIVAVAAHPFDSNHLWAGYYANGGLAVSHDRGQAWTPYAVGLADNVVFDLLSVADARQAMVWAATRDGLFASADEGDSWQPVTGLPPVTVFALAVDAQGRLYAGFEQGGVYIQTPDHTGWQPLLTDPDLQAVGVISLAVSPDGQFIYAGTAGGGVFASADGGQTWVNTYPGKYATNIAVNPTNPQQAIASLREQTVEDDDLAKLLEDLSTQDRLARSNDGGQSWHTLPLDWAGDEVTSLLWLPDGTLGAGTAAGQLFRSVDGGDTWQGGVSAPGGGILDLAVDRAGRLLAASWTGLYASDDGGQNWTDLAPTLGSPNAQTVLNNHNRVLLGTYAGLYQWQPEARTWQPLVGGIPVTSLAAPPAGDPLYLGTIGDGVHRSDDGGADWHKLPVLGVGVPELVVNPQNANHLLLLAAWERPYESLDGGQTWHARWDGLGNEVETVSLTIDPLEPITYVGTEAGLYLSRENDIWQPVALNLLGQSVLALSAQEISATFGHTSVLYLGTTRGVYRSFDHGVAVQGVADDPGWGYGLEDISVTAFLIDPREPRLLYAGTAYNGVYQSVDGGQTWQPVGPEALLNDVIESMAWGPNGEIFMVAGGRVWLGEKEATE